MTAPTGTPSDGDSIPVDQSRDLPTTGRLDPTPATAAQHCEEELAQLEARALRRRRPSLAPRQGPEVIVDGQVLLNFASNDYLGLASDPTLVAAAREALDAQGHGAGASRLLAGSLPEHAALEADLAAFAGTPAALLFNSGYNANLGLLTALAGPEDVIFSDALNHASLIDGCRLSRARVHVYPHADVEAVASLLAANRSARRRIVVTESLFSMDGDIAPLERLAALARAHDAWLLVDEAHALGVVGPEGRGALPELGIRATALVGTFGKALGSFGAFVAADTPVVELLVNRARTFVFTTALPPSVAAATRAALRLSRGPEGERRRALLASLARSLREGLRDLGFPVPPGGTPIVPVVVGEAERALALSAHLRSAGILAPAIRPPTVPEGTSRLRLALTAAHRPDHVKRLLEVLRTLPEPLRPTSLPASTRSPAPLPPSPVPVTDAPRSSRVTAPGSSSSAAPPRSEARAAQVSAADKRHLWHPFTPMADWLADDDPLIIEAAQGCWLIDVHGRRYLDGVSSLWCNLHGHRVPELDAALREQVDRVAHSTLLGLGQTEAAELAADLVAVAPPGLTRVFYSDSGSSAVEIALKIAFQYQQLRGRSAKTRFAALGEAYHGDTLGSVSVGGIDLFHRLFHPLLFHVERVPPPYCFRCPWRLERPGCQLRCAADLVALIERRAPELAALVIEPLVQGAAGMILQPDGYLRRVADACRAHDVLLIVDEVATGFGRTGTLFACEQEGVAPDLMAVAKGLTGGYLPLAATLTTEAVFEAFLGEPGERRGERRTFFHGHTYTGNALACAVARASLRRIRDTNLLEQARNAATYLRQLLAEHIAPLPAVGEIRQRGLMVGIELVADRTTRTPFPPEERRGARACRLARDLGVFIRPLGDVVVLMPAPVMSREELLRLVEAAAYGIRRATAP